jgi:hypothetical protein
MGAGVFPFQAKADAVERAVAIKRLQHGVTGGVTSGGRIRLGNIVSGDSCQFGDDEHACGRAQPATFTHGGFSPSAKGAGDLARGDTGESSLPEQHYAPNRDGIA